MMFGFPPLLVSNGPDSESEINPFGLWDDLWYGIPVNSRAQFHLRVARYIDQLEVFREQEIPICRVL